NLGCNGLARVNQCRNGCGQWGEAQKLAYHTLVRCALIFVTALIMVGMMGIATIAVAMVMGRSRAVVVGVVMMLRRGRRTRRLPRVSVPRGRERIGEQIARKHQPRGKFASTDHYQSLTDYRQKWKFPRRIRV